MSPADGNKKLSALLKKLRTRFAGAVSADVPAAPEQDRDADIDTLLYSMLIWEASTAQAKSAWKRLHEHFVDYNDLRAALPDEIASVLGEKYPRADERALRIRSTLHDLYRRFHGVTLAPVRDMGKRDQKSLLESLEGLPPFAAYRTLLLRFDVHAIAVDDRLRDLLANEGAAEDSADPAGVSHMLERHIDADAAREFCAIFEAWCESEPATARKDRKPVTKTAKPAQRTTAKKAKSPATAKKSGKLKSGG